MSWAGFIAADVRATVGRMAASHYIVWSSKLGPGGAGGAGASAGGGSSLDTCFAEREEEEEEDGEGGGGLATPPQLLLHPSRFLRDFRDAAVVRFAVEKVRITCSLLRCARCPPAVWWGCSMVALPRHCCGGFSSVPVLVVVACCDCLGLCLLGLAVSLCPLGLHVPVAAGFSCTRGWQLGPKGGALIEGLLSGAPAELKAATSRRMSVHEVRLRACVAPGIYWVALRLYGLCSCVPMPPQVCGIVRVCSLGSC